MIRGVFLQAATLVHFENLIATYTASLFLSLVFTAIPYVFISLAFMAIANRTSTKGGWLAWMPVVGKPIVAARVAHKRLWPLTVFFVSVVLYGIGWLLMAFTQADFLGAVSMLCIGLGSIGSLLFIVMFFIWHWNMYKAVGRPGWWLLLGVVFAPLYFVFLGIVAWGPFKEPPQGIIDMKRVDTTPH